MEATGLVLLSLLAVIVSGFAARMTRLPVPLVQIVLGAAIYTSDLTSVVLDPQLFFLLFLPPLLFLDGWRIPNDALLRDAATILRLALGLVVFTVMGMGVFIHWLIPAMPLAVAFALAAVIAPTDPIAVSAIAVRTPVPPRLMHILQGESLLNDASGLICMRFAVVAALTGSFAPASAVWSFFWSALGGLAVGAALTWLVARGAAWASRRYGEDGGAQILITLLIPFGVYLLAERVHCSGILAVVAAGVTMSVTDVWQWRAATRLRQAAVWDSVQLATSGSIFVLLGEQIPALISAAPRTVLSTAHQNPAWLLLYIGVIVVALAALRFAWVWVSLRVSVIGARRRGDAPPASGWRLVMAMSLAGVRGAVTLAGVMTLPLAMHDGTAFPARDLAIVLAAGVIVVSLVLAATALPGTLRGLELAPEPSRQAAQDKARMAAAEAAILAVEAAQQTLAVGRRDAYRCAEAAARIVEMYRQRVERSGGGSRAMAARDKEDDIERQLRVVGLHAERDELLRHTGSEGLDDAALRRLVRALDHQEARYGG